VTPQSGCHEACGKTRVFLLLHRSAVLHLLWRSAPFLDKKKKFIGIDERTYSTTCRAVQEIKIYILCFLKNDTIPSSSIFLAVCQGRSLKKMDLIRIVRAGEHPGFQTITGVFFNCKLCKNTSCYRKYLNGILLLTSCRRTRTTLDYDLKNVFIRCFATDDQERGGYE